MGNAELIATARESVEAEREELGPDAHVAWVLEKLADSLEAAEWQYRELQATVKPTVDALAAAQAVIAAANKLIPGIQYRDMDELAETERRWAALSQPPTDALQAVKAAAWDEGHGAGYREANKGPLEDFPVNPHRQAQRRLEREWPVLARAIIRAVSPKDSLD